MSKVFKGLDGRIARIQKAAENKDAPKRKAEEARKQQELLDNAILIAEADIRALQERIAREAPAILSRKNIQRGDYVQAVKCLGWMLPTSLKFTVAGVREICVALMLMWGKGEDFFLTQEYQALEHDARAHEIKCEDEEKAFRDIANKVIADLRETQVKTTLKSGREVPVIWNYHATMKAIRFAAPIGFRGLRGVIIAQQVIRDNELDDRWSQFMEEDIRRCEIKDAEFRAKKEAERLEDRKTKHKQNNISEINAKFEASLADNDLL